MAGTGGAAPEWIVQYGTAATELSVGARLDPNGDIYAFGTTSGSLGPSPVGRQDAFVRKYDKLGKELWTAQYGGTSDDELRAGTVDSSGNPLIAGYIQARLPGESWSNNDAFLRKYDPQGQLLWGTQFGTSVDDVVNAIATSGSDAIYLAGTTLGSLDATNLGSFDVILRRYDGSGGLVWSKQYGTAYDEQGVLLTIDPDGNVILVESFAGINGAGTIGQREIRVRKLLPDGSEVWHHDMGWYTADTACSVTADATGAIYVGGWTDGSFLGPLQGGSDGFVQKLDRDGNALWGKQIGSGGYDNVYGVFADPSGTLWVTGYTQKGLESTTTTGPDIFIQKYTSDGALIGYRQIQSPGVDYPWSIELTPSNQLLIGGWTQGALPNNSNYGGKDAFVGLLDPL